MTSPHTRKPVIEFTEADLKAYPAWEMALDEEGRDGQDESYARPVSLLDDSLPLFERFEEYMVAADFTSARGKTYLGFMELTSQGKRRIKLRPGALVGDFGYAYLPQMSRAVAKKKGLQQALEDRQRFCETLSASEKELFPLTYVLRLRVADEPEARTGKVR